MTYLSDLTTIRDQLVAELKTATLAHVANPTPTYNVGGRSFDWMGYKSGMMKAIADANQAVINATGACEIHTALLG